MHKPLNLLVRQNLGKGEVVSSILTGSTIKAYRIWVDSVWGIQRSRSYARTDAESRTSIGVKSVE
jgi:hypothetical protein